jgi:hypothetical protein
VKAEDVPALIQFLESQSEWLYSDGQNSSRGVYNERIEAVKQKVNAIAKRYENFENLKFELSNLVACLKFNF